MRSSFVVKTGVACWIPIIQRIPKQQNNPTIFPLFQEYKAPPNDTAIIPEQRAPANNIDPRISMRRARIQVHAGEAEVF